MGLLLLIQGYKQLQELLLLLLVPVLCLILWLVSLDHAVLCRLHGVFKSFCCLLVYVAELERMQARFAALWYQIATSDQIHVHVARTLPSKDSRMRSSHCKN